jgi:hypothetical protein
VTEILILDTEGWQPRLAPGVQDAAVRAIEGGGVIVLPHAGFELREDEKRFLSAQWSDGHAKNISVEHRNSARRAGAAGPGKMLRGAASAVLGAMMLVLPDPSAGEESSRLRGRARPPVVRAVRAPGERFDGAPLPDDAATPTAALHPVAAPGVALKGASGTREELEALAAMIDRFAGKASALVQTLFPRYAPYAQRARTSYRPQPAVGRDVSWRKDDSRLHVDAFPSRPNRGERILRVFTNLNPVEPRVWRVGETFETMAKTLLPRIRAPLPGSAALLAALHVTKGLRSEYDHLMLNLHDRAKEDMEYQRNCAQKVVAMAPGTTWLCFSDQVMHAAVSGQYMLEQTIHIPVSALYDKERAPLAILQRLTGRALVPAA